MLKMTMRTVRRFVTVSLSVGMAAGWLMVTPVNVLAADKADESAEKTMAAVQEVIGNLIAIKTGQVRDGEHIPLPVYADGKQASRKESQYFVSPAEVPTSLTYVATSGAFYIKCKADKDGLVHISLWQMSGTGEGLLMVGADSYKKIKDQLAGVGGNYANVKISSPTGNENVVADQMRALTERLLANYMVISIRSNKP